MRDLRSKYTTEMRAKVLKEFTKLVGNHISKKNIEKVNGEDLFHKLTGNRLASGGIEQFLRKSRNPEAWDAHKRTLPSYTRRFNKNNNKIIASSNPLFNLIQDDKAYIVVPSHGDIYCYETQEEVKEAIEGFKSPNFGLIQFKLLKVLPLKVQAKIECEIG